jgi:hypothetical protein
VKTLLSVFIATAVALLCATPVLAAGLSISPGVVEFNVPADGSTTVEFIVYEFTGNLEISLEDIPLTVEPTTVSVTKEGGTRVVLTFYGDESLGSQVFNGKIRFLALTGGTVAMGIKVRATVNHIASGQPLPEETPPPKETPPAPPGQPVPQTPPQESPTPPGLPPGPPPATSGTTEWPIIPLAGIAAGTAIVITIIVMVAKRKRY